MFANHPRAAIDYCAMRSDELVRLAETHQRATVARRGRAGGQGSVVGFVARLKTLYQARLAATRPANEPARLEDAAPAVS